MIRRSIRIGFRIGLLAGIAFALFKLVQSRKSSLSGGGADWGRSAGRGDSSSRPGGDTPLVEPTMLRGVTLKKDAEEATGLAAPTTTDGHAPSPAETDDVAASEPAPAPEAKRPAAPAKKAAKKAAKAARKSPAKAWVDPKGSFCPSSHPVKAKLSSGIYHLPGMVAYERTNPDRCYRDGPSAEGDGLRKAKR